jgi:hypothetical protein
MPLQKRGIQNQYLDPVVCFVVCLVFAISIAPNYPPLAREGAKTHGYFNLRKMRKLPGRESR